MPAVRNPNGIARHGSYAWFAGTGPDGRTCGDCAARFDAAGKVYCRTFAVITGARGKPIDADTAACREFRRRETQGGVT